MIYYRERITHGKLRKIWVARWNVNNTRIEYQFSEGSHGKYAEELARLTDKYKRRIYNKIEEDGNGIILYLYSKTYGYHNVLLDLEDKEKVENFSWTLKKRPSGGFYVHNSKCGKIHRYLLSVNDSNVLVDHIDRNTLNNRKSNLRLVNHIQNGQNCNIGKNNTSGFQGVYYSKKQNYWYASITVNKNTETRSFSVNKYGYDKARKLAEDWRLQKEKQYGFLGPNKK